MKLCFLKASERTAKNIAHVMELCGLTVESYTEPESGGGANGNIVTKELGTFSVSSNYVQGYSVVFGCEKFFEIWHPSSPQRRYKYTKIDGDDRDSILTSALSDISRTESNDGIANLENIVLSPYIPPFYNVYIKDVFYVSKKGQIGDFISIDGSLYRYEGSNGVVIKIDEVISDE